MDVSCKEFAYLLAKYYTPKTIAGTMFSFISIKYYQECPCFSKVNMILCFPYIFPGILTGTSLKGIMEFFMTFGSRLRRALQPS